MHFSPVPMHIPDGMLSVIVAIFLWVPAAISVGIALRQAGRALGARQVPLMGVLAAAIFAGQMLNFPIAAGTSGHLLGAALAAILVGPWAAVVVMTAVVSLQALIFQDGGLLALGGNLLNMAVIGVAVAHFVYTSVRKISRGRSWGIFLGGALAGWSSVVAASLACALELALSGTSPANISVPAMGGIHILIGLGEAGITAGALSFLFAARRDLLQGAETAAAGGKAIWVGGLLIAALLVVLSPLASARPDGLEWVAEQQGFLENARAPLYDLIPDYIFPGISNQALATILAGLLGVLLLIGAALGASALRRRKIQPKSPSSDASQLP